MHHRLFVSTAMCLAVALSISLSEAQNQPASGPQFRVVGGTVEKVSGNLVYIKTDVRLIVLSVYERTEVWKGKEFHDLSTVELGDDITARYRADASGKFVADAMWLNGVNVFGVITKVTDDGFQMLTNPNADPQSGYKTENKIVKLDADTIFEASAREDLKPGREVQTVGLDLKNGEVRATRLTIYEGKRPVRMGNGRIILPNGQIR